MGKLVGHISTLINIYIELKANRFVGTLGPNMCSLISTGAASTKALPI